MVRAAVPPGQPGRNGHARVRCDGGGAWRGRGLASRAYAGSVRIGGRAWVIGMLASLGLLSLGELAGQLLLADPVTPQRLAALAVAVLAAVARRCGVTG